MQSTRTRMKEIERKIKGKQGKIERDWNGAKRLPLHRKSVNAAKRN